MMLNSRDLNLVISCVALASCLRMMLNSRDLNQYGIFRKSKFRFENDVK